MLIAGIVFMMLGAIALFFSMSTALLIPVGCALFALGLLLALFGAVVHAVDRLSVDMRSANAMASADFRKGIESLCQRLDTLIRAGAPIGAAPGAVAYAVDGVPATASDAAHASGQVAPVVRPMPIETGKCPKCGRPRVQFDLGCSSCGSKQPAVFP